MQINTSKPQVLIVGAGIGGIATAARLARQGCRVTVLEKNEIPGGRVGQLKLDGYTFDTGATLLLMPEVYAETFTALGERIQDHLDLRRVDPTYHLYFPDRSQLQLTSDMHTMQAQLESMQPGSFEQMLRYLAEGRRIYDLSIDDLVGRDFRSLSDFINPRMLLLFSRLNALARHTDYAGRFFKDPRLLMAFTFQDMYMGLSPYDSPATYSLMPSTELADGVWYPHGRHVPGRRGAHRHRRKAGRGIHLRCPRGTDPGRRAACHCCETGGWPHAQGRYGRCERRPGLCLPQAAARPGRLRPSRPTEYGCSTIMFYWGLDRQYPQLGPHNLFLNGDYRQSFEAIFKKKGMPENPNFYIHAPARIDPSMAPAGHDTWYVAVPVGHVDEFDNEKEGETNKFWHSMQHKARAYVLRRLGELGFPEVEAHIKEELSFVPQWWQNRYNLTRGSTHGLSHKLTQMAYLRPHNRHSRYHNLYFVGASTHPGTGVPTVLISARLAAERILEEKDF